MGLRFDVEVSLALGADLTADPGTWSWTDITAYTMLAEGGGVTIHRGRDDEQTRVSPSWCTVQLNNADGRFSRLNPTGAYYGQLQKNTPLRIRACEAGGSLVTRFVGYVSEWPPRWTHGQKHKWVSVRADGVLRRLTQGSMARSAINRTINRDVAGFLVAHWPMEDASNASVLAAAVAGGTPAEFTDLDLASDSTLAGSRPLPTLTSTSRISAGLSGSFSLGAWSVTFLAKFNGAPSTLTTLLDISVSGGSADQWVLAADSTTLYVTGYVAGVSTFTSSGTTGHSALFGGEWAHVRVLANTFLGGFFGVQVATFASSTPTGPSLGSGPLTPGSVTGWTIPASTELADMAIGHLAVFNDSTGGGHSGIMAPSEAALGYAGETDIDRFNRLCIEEGIPHVTASGEGIALGPQPVADAVAVLRDSEAAGQGLLYEALTGELAYQPLRARYNLAVDLALDHDQGNIVAPFEPADDDLLTRNDVTVTRVDGTSARATDDDSIAAVGRVDEELTLNLYTDDQAADVAAWRLHIGTVDDYRYPTVTLALHKSTSLVADWLACDISSRLTIDNMPADVTPNLVDQIIEGCTERISSVAWDVAVNLSPGEPYDIGTYQDTTASGDVPRHDTEWSKLCTGLQLPGTSGNYASTPDNAALDITGDIDIRVECTLQSYASGSVQTLLSKVAAAPNRSYALRVRATGFLQLLWSADGTNDLDAISTAAIPVEAGGRIAVRATLDVDNGASGRTVTFYTAPTMTDTFTQLGDAVTTAGVTSIASTSAPVEIGSAGGGTTELATGVIHEAIVMSGIAGTEVAHPAFDAQASGTTSFNDTPGRAWTVNGTAAIFGPLVTGTATSMLVATRVPPLWTTSPPGGFPILVKLSGAVLSVTNITGSSPIQTFTISTTVANGITKSINGGPDLHVFRPAYFAL